jgi:hypothetical protein
VTGQGCFRSLEKPIDEVFHGDFSQLVATDFWSIDKRPAALEARNAAAFFKPVKDRHDGGVG